MTEATPLASEQITQEDHIREMAEANAERHAFTTDVDVAAAVELAVTVGLTLSASPAPSGQGVSGEVDCERCAGNGEIVTDWPIYMHGRDGANADDEATKDCPDCDGTGHLAAPAPSCAPGEVERLLAEVKTAARYVAVGDGYFDLYATAADAVDAAVDRLAAALSPQGLDAKEGGE